MYWFDTDLDLMVYAITDTKKGEQGLRLLIFKLPQHCVRLVFTLFHDLLCLLSPGSVLRFAVVDKTQHRNFV